MIVGAGPTGLVLANLLGKAGIRTLLVETNDATVGEPRAVSIDDESLRTVQAIGLLETVEKEIVRGYGSEYRSPAGRVFLRVEPKAEPYGHPRRNAFRQPIFEAQLHEGLKRFVGVETLFRCTVERFTEDAAQVSARLRFKEGGTRTVRADFMVGCDGARSSVREALGYAMVGDTLDEKWLIIDLEASPAPSRETVVFCDPRRPCVALPGPHSTRRYEFKVMPGESEAQLLSDASVAALLASHDAAPGSQVIRKTVYHFHSRIAQQWGRGRVWLAGDAAHLSPPFAGQGMNSGVRDAQNLAWKLAEVLRGRLGPGLLRTYQQERASHVGEMIRLALRMGSVMGPRSWLHGAVTRAAFRSLALWPAARSYFAEMKYKPPPRFTQGFLVDSMLTRNGIVGRMIPQPRLRAGPDAAKRLDDLLGACFVLLGIDVDQEIVNTLSLGECWDRLIDQRLALASSSAPELSEHAGHLLIVRPDRYVAARFAARDVARAVPELERMVAQTWQATDSRFRPTSAVRPRLGAALLTAALWGHAAAGTADLAGPQAQRPAACHGPRAIWAPSEWADCAVDVMSRPHFDYGKVIALSDVTYSVIEGFRPIKLTLYLPKSGREPFPIVVYVHGGGWKLDPEGVEGPSGAATLVRLAGLGYAVAVPSYRTSGEATFPAQLIDVKAAIRYMKTYAARYRADKERVVIWGASAGGNLAALAATTCHLKQFDPVTSPTESLTGLHTPFIDPDVTSCVVAAIDWFGPTDFSQLDAQTDSPPAAAGIHGAAGSRESDYLGCALVDCPSERLQAANPISYLSTDEPPMLLMHGLADRRVPWKQSQELYDALIAKGVNARLVLVPGADHLFEGISEQLKQQQVDTVIQWITAYTRH